MISGDEITREVMVLNDIDSPDKCYFTRRDEVAALLESRLQVALAQHKDIVLDVLNISAARRKRNLDLAKAVCNPPYHCEAVVFHPPEQEEHAQRLIRRLIYDRRAVSSDGLYQSRLEAEYSEPTKAEGYDKITYIGTPPKKPLLRM